MSDLNSAGYEVFSIPPINTGVYEHKYEFKEGKGGGKGPLSGALGYGYLPIDKRGADLLFQVISHRYEQGSIIISTNCAFKYWPEIFNNDATLTSAILDRVLHHAETEVVEGKSYRMKDTIK